MIEVAIVAWELGSLGKLINKLFFQNPTSPYGMMP
jgi:hypothetical protein